MKISVLLGSNRPGGVDVALAGLVPQTFEDFEVVFVDGRYHTRHAEVLDAVRDSGLRQPFYHVPNHRFAPLWGTTCAGYNTGFALCEGDVVVMLLDYAYAPPGWLAHHWAHAGKLVMAPHEYRTMFLPKSKSGAECHDFEDRTKIAGLDPRDAMLKIAMQIEELAKGSEVSIFDEPFRAEDLPKFPREASDAKCDLVTGPLSYHYFNTKNESFPLEHVIKINGMDENYDRGRGPGDPDLGLRLSRSMRMTPWNVQEAIVHCLNPRKLMPNLNVVIPEDRRLPPPYSDRWYIQDGYRYFDPVIKDEARVRAPNPFEMTELRKELADWKEMSQLREPVIPRNVVPDEDYFF